MVSINPEGGPRPASRRDRRAAADPAVHVAAVAAAATSGTARPRPTPRSLKAGRARRMIGPLPVSSLVGLEVLAAGGLLYRMASTPLHFVLLAGGAALGLLLLVPMGAGSLGTTLARRVAFATRPRLAADERSTGPASALFAGMVLRPARDQRGRAFGVVEWAGTATAVVMVTPGDASPMRYGVPSPLPLSAIVERLAHSDIPLDALVVHTLSVSGNATTAPAATPWRGRRDLYLAVRLRPLSARAALARRGGGVRGVDACLAALTGAVAAEVRAAGLSAQTLDVEALLQALDDVAVPVGTPGASPGSHGAPGGGSTLAPWAESWSSVTGPVNGHVSLIASAWHPGPTTQAPTEAGPDATDRGLELGAPAGAAASTVLEIRPAGAAAAVRLLVRTSALGVQAAAVAAAQMRSVGARAGVAFGVLGGSQLAGARATCLLGDGRVPGAPAGPTHPEAVADITVPLAALDRLAPRLGVGIPLGDDDRGRSWAVDLVHARPQRVVTVGEGWVASALAGRAVRAGIRVVVVTDRPAPWQALIRQVAGDAEVAIVPPDARTLVGDGEKGARLIIVEGPGAAPGARQPWQTVLNVLPDASAGESLLPAADLVLVTAGAAAEELDRPLGLDQSAAGQLQGMVEFAVACVSGGKVTVVRMDPSA